MMNTEALDNPVPGDIKVNQAETKKIVIKKTNLRHIYQEKIFSLVNIIFSAFKIIKINSITIFIS